MIAIPSAKVSDYFQWSSPTVSGGRIYIGVSSHCDNPLVRGGIIGYTQATGKVFARYFDVPNGVIGGSVWSSVAAATWPVRLRLHRQRRRGARRLYDTTSIVELRASTLARVASFQPPASQRLFDTDFGASPTLFGSLVGACNKNGIFYALRVPSMKVAWERRVATSPGSTGKAQCIASSAYDGTHLYVAATSTAIGGKTFAGSIRQLSPVTGRVLWQTGLPNGVIGTPTLDGGGVVAVGTYGTQRDAECGVPGRRADRPRRPHPDHGQYGLRAERLRGRLAVHGQRNRRVRLGPVACTRASTRQTTRTSPPSSWPRRARR